MTRQCATIMLPVADVGMHTPFSTCLPIMKVFVLYSHIAALRVCKSMSRRCVITETDFVESWQKTLSVRCDLSVKFAQITLLYFSKTLFTSSGNFSENFVLTHFVTLLIVFCLSCQVIKSLKNLVSRLLFFVFFFTVKP